MDIGCSIGLLAVQLALNGATHVCAIALEKHTVANVLASAFRNGVVDRGTPLEQAGRDPSLARLLGPMRT